MALPWVLLAWSAAALAWWLAAARLVARSVRPAVPDCLPDRRRISVFKPLAGNLQAGERRMLEQSLETFVAELDRHSELLLGVHAADEAHWQRWAGRMLERHPAATLRLVADPRPGRLADNPKVSWMRLLSTHATGSLWLWSDADMQAPPGALQALRREFAAARVDGAGMVTCPYVVRQVGGAPALLDALYVNLEHHPGAVLLARLDRIRFGFGAGMLFEADAFRRHVDWDDLGRELADDFHLGRKLAPVRLAATRLVTSPACDHWGGALQHYHRWRKTIRWCAPGGFAAEVLVLPALGWLAAAAWNPAASWPWLGLGSVMAMDAVAAQRICARVGCRIPGRHAYVLPAWTLIRALMWLVCWLPIPIRWRDTWWRAPRRYNEGAARHRVRRQGARP